VLSSFVLRQRVVFVLVIPFVLRIAQVNMYASLKGIYDVCVTLCQGNFASTVLTDFEIVVLKLSNQIVVERRHVT
jgi:hypothetical protein